MCAIFYVCVVTDDGGDGMASWEHVWSDKAGSHREVTEADTAREAKRALYERLGVKRLVGVRTELVEGEPCPCGATVFGEPASVDACGCTVTA